MKKVSPFKRVQEQTPGRPFFWIGAKRYYLSDFNKDGTYKYENGPKFIIKHTLQDESERFVWLKFTEKEMSTSKKYKVKGYAKLRTRHKIKDTGGRPFIQVRLNRYYLDDFDKSGYHMLSYTNCGYYAGFIIDRIEYGIDDFAIIKEV